MLKQRVLTAIVLLALFVPALFMGNSGFFIGLTLLLTTAGVWEWARMSRLGPSASLGLAGLGFCMMAAMWWTGLTQSPDRVVWTVLGLLWLALTPIMLKRGVDGWATVPVALSLPVGVVLILSAWLAMAQAKSVGNTFLLSILVLVWAADIFAYFGGKALGRVKLAPKISPGKSREGAVSGALAVLLIALIWAQWPEPLSLFGVLLKAGWWFVPVLMVLVGMSIAGDLIESLVKRGVGIKDSSQLLPGHGGVLDRIDALLPVLPLSMMFYAWLV